MLISVSKKPQLEHNLYKYIDYIETFGETEEYEVNTSTSASSVTITTIHSSKGLEYPIVILIGAGRDFTKTHEYNEILINKNLGFGVRYYDLLGRTRSDTIVRNAINEKNKEQQLAEEMRLFYVAITRAKNHLVLIGKISLKKIEAINSGYSIKNAKSYLEWVLGSLRVHDLNALKQNKSKIDVKLDKDTTCSFDVCDISSLSAQLSVQAPLVFAKPNAIYKQQFERVFNFKYAHTSSSEVVAKSTVTEVLQKDDEVVSNYSIKKFRIDEVFKTREELDFSRIGSVYHLVMENIDFSITTMEELDKKLSELIESRVLPIDTLELIDKSKILKATLAVSQLIKDATDIRREQQFMMYVPYNEVFKNSLVEDKILIQGVIDLIVVKKDEIIIVDYKTTRLNSEEELAKKYATQLNLYKKAYELASGKTVSKKLIYSFYLNNMVNVWQKAKQTI